MGATLLAILALALVFGYIVLRIEKLTLFGPKSTAGITPSADAFCTNHCRLVDGRCPLSGSQARALNCALWKFVEADVATIEYGSPFTYTQS
jgi:hypothetical protein